MLKYPRPSNKHPLKLIISEIIASSNKRQSLGTEVGAYCIEYIQGEVLVGRLNLYSDLKT